MRQAFITGLRGPILTDAERAFLKSTRPAGIILFSRNCLDGGQIQRLIGEARTAIGGDALVLVDQEGGRVQRLRPPLALAHPPAAAYGALYGRDKSRGIAAARLGARLIAEEIGALGFNMDCAPVLDVPVAGAHDVIGDRAFGHTVDVVVALGRAVAQGLLDGGIAPVIKHIPGHGRATKDSHHDLPVVATPLAELAASDFAPFEALSDLPAAMTAHVVYAAIDPQQPASTSRQVTEEIVRGAIGFDGLLMSDDLTMRALSGTLQERTEAVIRSGSDLALHCNGDIVQMEAVAGSAARLSGMAQRRFERAVDATRRKIPFDRAEAVAALHAASQAMA